MTFLTIVNFSKLSNLIKVYILLMKKLFIIISILSFGFAREHVAIIDFENIDVTVNEAKALTQRLTTEMIKLGEFTVLERSEMKKVLDEQKFQYSGCVDTQCAVKIGQMLGAKYMIVGSVSKIGNTYSVDSRLINVETSESYGSADFSHTGEIDYVLTEGMKSIAYKLCDMEYQVKPPAPVKTTITMDTQNLNNTGQVTAGATLSINSTPSGANIFIDDNFIGNTPLDLANYPVGEYIVKVEMDKYYSEEKTVKLVPMGRKNLNIELSCRYRLDCLGMCGGSAINDRCGICDGDDSSCKDDCGIIYGNNKDKDCDGVCFGKNLPKEYCYDANGDGDGDVKTKQFLCTKEVEKDWVNNCTNLTGDLLISSQLNDLHSIEIGRLKPNNISHPVNMNVGIYELSAKSTYLFKDFEIRKSIEIFEDEMTTVYIKEDDIAKEKKYHRKQLTYTSSAVFALWLTWALVPYDM